VEFKNINLHSDKRHLKSNSRIKIFVYMYTGGILVRGEFKFKRDNVNKTKADAARKNFSSYDFFP
jgi:hypothetical protein